MDVPSSGSNMCHKWRPQFAPDSAAKIPMDLQFVVKCELRIGECNFGMLYIDIDYIELTIPSQEYGSN